jgi:hypothetical protein
MPYADTSTVLFFLTRLAYFVLRLCFVIRTVQTLPLKNEPILLLSNCLQYVAWCSV